MKKCSFFSLSLCLSLLNCVFNKTLLLLFMKFLYKIWDHFWKKKRKERKKFGEDTYHTSVRTKWCFVRTKIFGKRIPQTHVNWVSQTTHWNPTLIKNTKKTKTPTNAQKKKWCVPRWKVAFSALTCEVLGSPGGNALAVLYRRYCVELKVYDGWYISLPRAQGGRFFARIFFCILGDRGVQCRVWKLVCRGFVVHFCQNKHTFF